MITAIVMVGAGGQGGGPDSWVQSARRAATLDLVEQLAGHPLIASILLVSPEKAGLQDAPVHTFISTPRGQIHVGRQLAQLVEEFKISRLLYFGGGSAPLLSDEALHTIVEQVAGDEVLAVTNNKFASDWLGLSDARLLSGLVPRLPRDNMLGWVLANEAQVPVQALAASAASRLDIDTPVDMLALHLHPRTKKHLRRLLDTLPLPVSRLQRALEVLETPASHVFFAGRLGPEVWLSLNQATHSWLRVVSEERGMVSSGRQSRGEVRSLLASYVDQLGLEAFFETMSQWADAAFIDTRVLLAHHRRWPDPQSRFASDLGRPQDVADEFLRDFTERALQAAIPVVLGGHGLMSGAMLALCEILQHRKQAA